jgi:hypothetical protein
MTPMEDAMTLTSECMEFQRQARASTGRTDSARNDPDFEVQAADVIGLSLHVTPTYSSWLNQVELWFAKIERDVIARGILYLGAWSHTNAHARYPALQYEAQTREVEVLRCVQANYS